MSRKAEIVRISIEELQCFAPRRIISRADRLVEDLKIASDDSTSFIIAVERRLGIDMPQHRWQRISTVQDILDALVEFDSSAT